MPSTVGPLILMTLERLDLSDAQMPTPEEIPDLFLKEPSSARAYHCHCASQDLFEILNSGKRVEAFVAQIIREDAEQYFVFASFLERELFLELRNLDSVGPKTAAAFMWFFGVEGIQSALSSQTNTLGKAPGLGPKTMEKILSQLWSKREKILPRLPQEKLRTTFSHSNKIENSLSSLEAVPAVVLQTMEKLGLKTLETQKLWKELCAEDPLLPSLEKADLLKRLLQGWGRVKSIVTSSAQQET